jgi:uncharacterized protein
MQYRPRNAEPRLADLARYFRVVLVTGARQVGKSTLIERVFPEVRAITFDPLQDLYGARSDPDLFLDSLAPPLVLDEIQYAPELLPALKRRVDRSDQPGQYILTGSQNLAVLRGVAESMAGRVGILQLDGMTHLEQLGRGREGHWLDAYLSTPDQLPDKVHADPDAPGPLTRVLWRGTLPGLLDLPDEMVPAFWRAYVQTYVERDVRVMAEVKDLAIFGRFLSLQGALTAQEINDSQAGREIGVAPGTARAWRDLLSYTYQWTELFPYVGNTVKRVSGKRKGYLQDVGLASHLQRLSSPEALLVSPLRGALFETWVVNELLRASRNLTVPPQSWHWRTHGGAEVDLILERDGRLFPIEVKARTNPSKRDTRGLRAFRETYGEDRVAPGLVIHAGHEVYRLDRHTVALPWCAVLREG